MLKQEVEEKECVHYWIIDFPEGPTSTGKCKYCGVVKHFYNYYDSLEQSKRDELEKNRHN